MAAANHDEIEACAHATLEVSETANLDTVMPVGHTIVTADLDGDGKDEIVAGFRGEGRSVYIYTLVKGKWTRRDLDKGGIAAAACIALDLNGDGRKDVACIGSASTNLKWYENMGK